MEAALELKLTKPVPLNVVTFTFRGNRPGERAPTVADFRDVLLPQYQPPAQPVADPAAHFMEWLASAPLRTLEAGTHVLPLRLHLPEKLPVRSACAFFCSLCACAASAHMLCVRCLARFAHNAATAHFNVLYCCSLQPSKPSGRAEYKLQAWATAPWTGSLPEVELARETVSVTLPVRTFAFVFRIVNRWLLLRLRASRVSSLV